MVACLLTGGATAREILPGAGPHIYRSIPDRNAFKLKPGQELEIKESPQPALPKIILTGITTILRNKRALMMVIPPVRPGEQPKESSLILAEGQREGDVEVLQIDDNAGTVKVINSGRETTLSFEKDAAKLPATLAPVPGPGAPATAVIPTPAGVTNPGSEVVQRYHLLPRAWNLPTYHPATLITPAGEAIAAAAPVSPASNTNAAPAGLTAEQQAALTLIEREAARTTGTLQ